MTDSDVIGKILARHGLRDTQTRRSVLQALAAARKPLSPAEIRASIVKRGNAINVVTVYRILDVFVKLGTIHRHPYQSLFRLCTLPDTPGHHGFLHCDDCGKTEEFHDERLCHIENDIAKQCGYAPKTHISEIRGTCSHCS